MGITRQTGIARGLPKEKRFGGVPWDLDRAFKTKAKAAKEVAEFMRGEDFRAKISRVTDNRGNIWHGVYVRLKFRT